jgi:hypothetical protein
MPLPGQGKRIEKMIFELTAALGRRVTLADYGEMVGKVEKGRQRPYSAGAVSEWIQERNEPSFAATVAMSAVSRKHAPPGHSAAWIAGFETEDEVPVLPAVPAQTEAEKAAAKKPSRRRPA